VTRRKKKRRGKKEEEKNEQCPSRFESIQPTSFRSLESQRKRVSFAQGPISNEKTRLTSSTHNRSLDIRRRHPLQHTRSNLRLSQQRSVLDRPLLQLQLLSVRVRLKEDGDSIDLIRVGRALGESSGEFDESGQDELGGERIGVRGVENRVEEVDDV